MHWTISPGQAGVLPSKKAISSLERIENLPVSTVSMLRFAILS